MEHLSFPQFLTLCFSALAGLWAVLKLVIGSYLKQKEKIAHIERQRIEASITTLRLITTDHSKEIRQLSVQLIGADKNMIKFAAQFQRFEEKLDRYQHQEDEMMKLLTAILGFINGSSDKSEVIQLGNSYLVRKKK